jgi:hypothetical protein
MINMYYFWQIVPTFGSFRGYCCYNYLSGPCAGLFASIMLVDRHYPRYRTGRGLYRGRGGAKTMNTDEVKNYILAAALVVTGMFLIAIALSS